MHEVNVLRPRGRHNTEAPDQHVGGSSAKPQSYVRTPGDAELHQVEVQALEHSPEVPGLLQAPQQLLDGARGGLPVEPPDQPASSSDSMLRPGSGGGRRAGPPSGRVQSHGRGETAPSIVDEWMSGGAESVGLVATAHCLLNHSQQVLLASAPCINICNKANAHGPS